MADKDVKGVAPGGEWADDEVGELLHDSSGHEYLVNSDYIEQEVERRTPSVDRQIELQLAKELLASNLRQLTKRQQDVLYYTMQGLTQMQIGKRLGVTVNVVREHLDAARKKLAKIITGTKEVLKEGLENGSDIDNTDSNS